MKTGLTFTDAVNMPGVRLHGMQNRGILLEAFYKNGRQLLNLVGPMSGIYVWNFIENNLD